MALVEEFDISDVPKNREFSIVDPLSFQRTTRTSPEIINRVVASLNASHLGTQDRRFIESQIETFGTSFFEPAARSTSMVVAGADFNRKVNAAIEISDLPAIVQAEEERNDTIDFVSKTSSPEVYAAARTGEGGTEYDHVSARMAARIVTFEKIAAELMEEETGTLNAVGDFFDLMVSSLTVDAFRLGGFERTDAARKATALMAADIPEDEFERELRLVLENAASSGLLTGSNMFFLGSQIENISEGGEGTEATLDRWFNVLDAAAIGSVAARGSLSALRRARNTTAIVSATKGPTAAAKNLADGMADPDLALSAGVPREGVPSMMRPPENRGGEFRWNAPGVELSHRVQREDSYLNMVRSLRFSQRIDPDVLARWHDTGLKRLEEKIDAENISRVIDMRVAQDDQANLFGAIVFGKKDGMPFRDRRSAERLAAQHGGTVEPIDRGGQTFYEVHVQKNLSSKGLADPITNEEIGTVFYGLLDDLKVYGGAYLSIPARLDQLAKRGEGVFVKAARDINKRLQAVVKKTPKEEQKIAERILFELRDGDRAFRRDAYNEVEFLDEWARHSPNPPSQNAVDYYFELQELNDSFYYLKADEILKRAVGDGYDEVVTFQIARADGTVDDWRLVSRRTTVESVPDGERAVNPISGEQFTKEQIKKDHKVFRLANPHEIGDDEFRFIVMEKPTTRRLHHTDVLGYNPGGPRQYGFVNHTVKQDRPNNRPVTLMGAATTTEVQKAAEQINNVLRFFREKIPGLGGMRSRAKAIDSIETLRATPDAEEIVRLNNEWNTNIESVDELVAFMRNQGIDPRVDVGFARMDAPIAMRDEAGELKFLEGSTYGDIFEFRLAQPSNGPRRDVPLRGYGGGQHETRSPLDTIQSDYFRVLHNKAFAAFNFQAVNGWLKGAENLLTAESKLRMQTMNPLRAMNAAEFADPTVKEARNFAAARSAINRVLGTKSEYEIKWDNFISRVAEWVYDKNRKSLAKKIDKFGRDPLAALRGWSFDARLGMLAMDQVIVQASQSMNIVAIMGPSRVPEFLQAAATHIPVRIALENGNSEVIRAVGRRVAGSIGMTPDEFEEYVEWVRQSGRLQIGGEVAEISNLNHLAVKGMVGKTREAMRLFFNEGEKFPRSVAIRVAWNEYKQQFPNADMFSNHAINWITGRQDALTAAMTRSSAASFQRGLGSIPFQFLTYITRMMESLFTDRLLTRAERGKLAIAQVLFWGSAGTGLSQFTVDSYIREGELFGLPVGPEEGTDISEFNYTALRYGLLNAVLNEAVGTQRVAIGGRLAPAEGVADLLENWSNNNFVEIVGGPAAQLITDVGGRLIKTVESIYSGNVSMTLEDTRKTLRSITSFSRGYQAWYIAKYGDYVSKSNEAVVSGLTEADAIMVLLGSSVQDANLSFDRARIMANEREELRRHTRRIQEYVREMNRKIDEDDMDSAIEIGDQIARDIAMLPPWQAREVRKGMAPDIGDMWGNLELKLMEQGRKFGGPERDQEEVQ